MSSASRMVKYLEDARWKVPKVLGGKTDMNSNYVQPTLVTDVPMDCELMHQEIFGPILPLLLFKHWDEAIQLINSKEETIGFVCVQ